MTTEMKNIFRKSSEVITIIDGYLRSLGNISHVSGIYILIKNYCMSRGIGLNIGDRGQIIIKTDMYRDTLPGSVPDSELRSGEFIVCCESPFYINHDPCRYICVQMLDKPFDIPVLIRYESTNLCDNTKECTHAAVTDESSGDTNCINFYDDGLDIDDIKCDNNEYIDTNCGYITSNVCAGFKTLDDIFLINQDCTDNIVGYFQKRNQFVLVSNKIYKIFNIPFICVESTILTGIYDNKIDLRLINKSVYIPLKDTNLWRMDTKYKDNYNIVQQFMSGNKYDLYCHSKKGTIFGDSATVCMNNHYGSLTAGDEIYLITPEYKDMANDDGICIYSPKYDSIGWIRWHDCLINLYNDTKTIESININYMLISDGNSLYLYGNTDPDTICYCIIAFESESNDKNEIKIIQLGGSSSRVITLKKSSNMSRAFGRYYWGKLS